MIAPSYWVDPKSGNDYMLTVQYPEGQIRSISDLRAIPLRGAGRTEPTRLDAVTEIRRANGPTEVDHYQLRRVIDVYVGLAGEDLGRVASRIEEIVKGIHLPEGVRVNLRGMVQGMRASFRSFAIGLAVAVALLYLILVAQFRSFIDPALILLAIPTGLTGVLATLVVTGTSLNVMSLMGVVMMAGIVVSNSILIVDFAHRLREQGRTAMTAVVEASKTRLRPILMTSFATIIGLLPMALKLGEGAESYAPLARAIIGGLTASLVFTIFLVPATYVLVYRRRDTALEVVK
jgi:multidrug efflux pump subunit AcrB